MHHRAGGRLGRLVRWPWVLVGPAMLYLIVFQAYPMVEGVRVSFTDAHLLRPARATVVGFDNYLDILGSAQFHSALAATLIYTTLSVGLALLLGLGTALFLNCAAAFRGLSRASLAIPWAAPEVAVALVFAWIFNNQFGVANFLLTQTGITDTYLRWFDNPTMAMPTVIFVTVWRVFPLATLVILAALQAVPREHEEAAMVDGADRRRVFRHVVLPAILTSLTVLTLLLTIWSLRRFSIIWLTTQGGPLRTTNTITVDVYRTSFEQFRLGYGAAIGILGVLIAVTITIVFLRTERAVERATGR